MSLEVKSNCKYAAACVTSMGVRITPENRMAVHNSNMFYMQATSAETNVLNVSSSLGLPCLALTKFVEGSPVAKFIKSELKGRGISYEGIDVPQGGPWGYRHQFNIADSGFGLRAPRVWNDRAGEVGRTLNASDFDLDRIFGEEGVGILHISGLIAAMSEDTTKCCLDVARAAKKYGTLVSFDLNYRATFWKGREEELSKAFAELASVADILIGNEDISANEHLWGAILLAEDGWHVEEPRPIQVMDRIGGGDGFSGGLLYGVLKGFAPEQCMQFGWATGVLAASSLNDYAEPADEKQVMDVYKGNARVQR